ncbi:MAG: hypothetical protein IPK21_03945 [Haliscomenobacter sp.]|nr:hypothetical protein [Haliscomenobacter sp.]
MLVDGEISKNRHFIFSITGDIQYKGIERNILLTGWKLAAESKPQACPGPLISRDAELNKLLDFASPLFLKRLTGVAFVFE